MCEFVSLSLSLSQAAAGRGGVLLRVWVVRVFAALLEEFRSFLRVCRKRVAEALECTMESVLKLPRDPLRSSVRWNVFKVLCI